MPDIYWNSRSTKLEIEKICDFWIGLSVDGFRLDLPAKEFSREISGKNIVRGVIDLQTVNKSNSYVVAEVWDTLMTAICRYYKVA